MKKLIALILALVMIFSLAACGGAKEEAPAAAAPAAAAPAAGTTAEKETAASTERTKPLTIRWGASGNGTATDMQWCTNSPIMDEITKKTNGMIVFEYYPSSQLGGENEMMDQVLMGTLDMCVVQPSTMSTVWPELTLMTYPFAYPSLTTYWDAWNNDAMRAAIKDLMGDKAVFLGTCTSAYRGCQNAVRPIRSVADMQGLTFRTLAGQLYVDLFGAMGAATASLAMSETFTALQQGLIDGEELTIAYSYQNGYYEAEKYATELNAVMSCSQIIMSTDTWDKLSDSEKAIFDEACYNIPREIQIEMNTKDTDMYYEKAAEAGMEVIRWADLTAEEQSSFVNAVMPIWDKYKENLNADFFALWAENCKAAWENNGFTWTYTA